MPRIAGSALALATLVVASLGSGCASSTATEQRVFSTPTAAAEAFFAAMRQKDEDALKEIFGPDSDAVLSSGDPVEDQHQREVVLTAVDQRWSLVNRNDREVEISIGDEDWPCPIPLVKEGSGWRFDTAAGETEVLARRIGRNELAVIEDFEAYVLAQREYAAAGRDGQPAGAYAQRIKSDPGMHNGLYWPTEPGEPASPLGALATRARAEGYDTATRSGTEPFHGYYFRGLTAQGPSAPGGARSYIEDGLMTGGFAIVAYPAEYGNSGIMTFMVNQSGVIMEADLGHDTADAAAAITSYDPDSSWQPMR